MPIKRESIPPILFGLLALLFVIVEYHRAGDFTVLLLASKAMINEQEIYAISYTQGFKYFYSPLFALLIYPLTFFSPEFASSIWNGLSFLLLARIFILIPKLFLPESSIKFRNQLAGLSIIAAMLPLYSNFHASQLSAFILYAILECLYLIRKPKGKLLGAGILALAINIKILPIVFIPYLLYRKQFQVVFYVFVFAGIFLLLPTLILGFKTNFELHAAWFQLLDPSKGSNIIDLHERKLHSIGSLVGSLFTDLRNDYELDLRRHLLVLDREILSQLINAVRVGIILLSFYFFRTGPFQEAKSDLHRFWETSFLCLSIPLLFPHQQVYAFLLMLPAIYYVVYALYSDQVLDRNSNKFKLILALAILCFLLINLELIFGSFRKYFWHFKTLTYSALFLLFLLAICKPNPPSKKEINLKTKPD